MKRTTRSRVLSAFLLLSIPSRLFADDACGLPPESQFRQSNNEAIKGDLEAKAQFLSKFVGDAKLGGEIEATRREVFAKYKDADTARMNAYLGYIFCKVVLDPNNNATFREKLDAIKEFKESISPRPIATRDQSGRVYEWAPAGEKPRCARFLSSEESMDAAAERLPALCAATKGFAPDSQRCNASVAGRTAAVCFDARDYVGDGPCAPLKEWCEYFEIGEISRCETQAAILSDGTKSGADVFPIGLFYVCRHGP